MIMTQEQQFLKAQSQLQDLLDYVRGASQRAERIDEVERGVFRQLLALGHTLLVAHVTAQGDGNVGETVQRGERTLRRLPEQHERPYVSIFGKTDIRRFVYGTREGQKIEYVPLDERLGLPAGDFSYVLEDWVQRFGVKESFQEAGGSLEVVLGLRLVVRSLEHMNRRMAEFAEPFRESQPAPPRGEEGAILVMTGDGKGVPMRRDLAERAGGPKRRTKGQKANQKQMAYVGAVYSIDPFVRSADDVLDELRREKRRADRPLPQHKRVWAEMTHVYEGEETGGKVLLFADLAQEVSRRAAEGMPLVCLMDGEKGLWEMAEELLITQAGLEIIGILDIFHVLERLWDVAHCVHAEGTNEAEEFVEHRLRMLLEGKVGYVIGGLRQMLSKRRLSAAARRTIRGAIGYYENNRSRMRYDAYLRAGYPIGSGVAEGACRHVVKDRMEGTGMRWIVEGAQAMLHLRSIYLNQQWDEFVAFRTQTEQSQLYGNAIRGSAKGRAAPRRLRLTRKTAA
jgi:hypothetical protein